MVFCVRERTNEEEVVMAMGQERSSKPLHNFTLPYLKWGHQRHLRCMKLEDSSAATTTTTSFVDQRSRRPSMLRKESDDASRRSRMDGGDEEGIEAVREKIINDLKTAADKMKDALLREKVLDEEEEEEEEEESPPVAVAAAVVSAPWNLRTRRAACKAPAGGAANKGYKFEERKPNSSPIRSEAKSPRLLRGDKEVKKERVKFSVNLTRKEIEEDFMTLVGHRPPRRPKKRPRVVQKQLDTLFPGLWLTEVTVDSYKVPELAENAKR